jgi:hypothetical protein
MSLRRDAWVGLQIYTHHTLRARQASKKAAPGSVFWPDAALTDL